MQCPNSDCGHSGFSPTGICPKCGDKMIPNHLLYTQKEKSSSWIQIGHLIFQVLARTLESCLFFALLYLVLWVFILSYNGLCQEMPDWTPVDFTSQVMTWIKGLLFLLVTFLTFRIRWRARWS